MTIVKQTRPKSVDPDGIYLQVLRELTNVTVKPLLISYERSQHSGQVPENCSKANITPVFMKGC